MNNKIIIMDEALASQIAAGEVVERPASVVKELVENSLDAEAKRITVEIHNGGKTLIRVTDDGCGMNPADAKLSLDRHATSKIKTSNDLFNISTLGFRGEALPSIASVSRTQLLTSEGESATLIKCEGSKVISEEEASAPRGTTVIVKDLFFNTPARLKYLKSDGVESAHISEVISRFVISSPSVSFRLLSNGREVIFSPGNGSLLDAISSVFGAQFAKGLIEVNGKGLRGFIGRPAETKATRDHQIFFVNGRIVKNFMLGKAAEAAYENLIPKERHPILLLFVEIDPKEIDVNVHPTKREIRFEKPRVISGLITETIKDALIDVARPALISSPAVFISNETEPVAVPALPCRQAGGRQVRLQALSEEFSLSSRYKEGSHDQYKIISRAGAEEGSLPDPVVQIALTYIVCSDDSGLVIIDQHAAHERILYEKVKKGALSKDCSQFLLMPEIIEFSPQDFLSLESGLELLSDLGFDMEVFGKNSFRIKALPSLLIKTALKPLLSDIASNIRLEDANIKIDEQKERIAKLIACHAAVKAGDRLGRNEMLSLIKELYATDNFSTCPHGRPAIVRIENAKIASFFGR